MGVIETNISTVIVDLNFMDYAKFILGFGGVDTLYDVTDEGIKALHKAYPRVRFVGRVDDHMTLELIVGLTEDECYGYMENRLIDNEGKVILENYPICSGREEDYTKLFFDIPGYPTEILLVKGGFKSNGTSKEASEVVVNESTERMKLF